MNKPRLGRFTLNTLVATALTLAVVGGFFVASGSAMFSPGKLNAQTWGTVLGGVRSHAELETDCAACHTAFWSQERMMDRCMDCHTGLMDQAKDFHVVMLAQGERAACQTCHTDHNGAEAPLTNKEMAGFPHDQVGFSLKTHITTYNGQSFACVDCHPHSFNKPKTQLCIDCHVSYQAEFMQQHIADFPGDCLQCHDGLDRFSDFDHGKVSFNLDGKHMQIGCSDCHHKAQDFAALSGLPQECNTCHAAENPHGDQFQQTCATCHNATNWQPSTFDHNRVLFKLTGKHAAVDCNDCHNSTGATGERLYRGMLTDCKSCHTEDDPHAGRFGQTCETCHTTKAWWPAEFDHDLATFALEGKHVNLICADCHTETSSQGHPVFSGTPADCFSCHEMDDAHQGNLGATCADCHTPMGWRTTTFDHQRSSFLLTGKHLSVKCADCHSQKNEAGHPIYRGTPRDCYTCHKNEDTHRGEFGTNCLECHTTQGWIPSTFDHSRAAFQLTGAHASAACQSCHTSGWKGTPTACASCHTDAHGGRFGSSCQTCHSTNAWRPASYNGPHSFPMNHEGANACSDCHPSSLNQWTCYTCHDQSRMIEEHKDEAGDITNCLRCHPNGRKEEGEHGD